MRPQLLQLSLLFLSVPASCRCFFLREQHQSIVKGVGCVDTRLLVGPSASRWRLLSSGPPSAPAEICTAKRVCGGLNSSRGLHLHAALSSPEQSAEEITEKPSLQQTTAPPTAASEMAGRDKGAGAPVDRTGLRGPEKAKATYTEEATVQLPSAGHRDDGVECVEIDATLEGISREGLLQLLRELQQQIPEVYRHLAVEEPSALEALPTEQLRALLKQLLDLAEAAERSDAPQPTRGPGPPSLGAFEEDQQQEPTQRHTRIQQASDSVGPLSGVLKRAASAADAADTAAAVEAQDLLESGQLDEEHSDMFAELQEQMLQLTDADVWDLLLTLGSVLEALVPSEVTLQQQRSSELQRQIERQQKSEELESVDRLLALAREQRKAMADEEAALAKMVHEKAGPLSSGARRDLLLTLVAVVEAANYWPKHPQVRSLLNFDPSAGGSADAESQSTAAAGTEGPRNAVVVRAWRHLLQQPENALAGGKLLSPEGVAALSDQEVCTLYRNLVAQARGEGLRASLTRLPLDRPGAPLGATPHSVSVSEGPTNSDLAKCLPESLQTQHLDGSQDTRESTGRSDHPPPKVQPPCLNRPPTSGPLQPVAPDSDAETRLPTAEGASKGPLDTGVFVNRRKTQVPAAATPLDVSPEAADAPPPVNTTAVLLTPAPLELGAPQETARTEEGSQDFSGPSETDAHAAKPQGLSKGPSRFAALGLSSSVSSAAGAILEGDSSNPTGTQRLAIPQILRALQEAQKRRHKRSPAAAATAAVDRLVALRAQTGSGKTLAFLLPLMQVLRDQEAAAAASASAQRKAAEARTSVDLLDCDALAEALRGDGGSHRAYGRWSPRALILCPSRPLAVQVASAAASLARHLRLSVVCAVGGVGRGIQRRLLQRRPVDILVGTPDRLLKLTRPRQGEGVEAETGDQAPSRRRDDELVSLAGVQFIILDEADALWQGGFREEVERLLVRSCFLSTTQTVPPRKQLAETFKGSKVLITCTATPDSGSEEELREALKVPAERFIPVQGGPVFPSFGRVRHQMMQVSGEDRFLLLSEQLRIRPDLRNKKVLVFCNTVSSCRACCHHLQAAGLLAQVRHLILLIPPFALTSCQYSAFCLRSRCC